jgi:hypothetical protein
MTFYQLYTLYTVEWQKDHAWWTEISCGLFQDISPELAGVTEENHKKTSKGSQHMDQDFKQGLHK